jgi:hypothetical protein
MLLSLMHEAQVGAHGRHEGLAASRKNPMAQERHTEAELLHETQLELQGMQSPYGVR